MKMIIERIFHSSKVMIWWLWLLPLTAAVLCRPGHQYWDEALEKCINCSKCPEVGHVVLRPCQVHQDTKCGPLSALDIDWSFLRKPHTTKSHKNSHHQHLPGENNHRELFLEQGHLHLNKDNKQSLSQDDKRESESEESLEDTKHFQTHKNTHPKLKSSEEKERKSHRKSHHKKWSSEESSLQVDETPRKHKSHHYHKKHSTSETHSIKSTKQPHNTKHNHQRQKFHWSSSEVVHSFEFPDLSNSSEVRLEDGHSWSFSETSDSFERHGTSIKKSNSTKKHSHQRGHHSHPHVKKTNAPETHKHHEKKVDFQSLQEEISVQRPESASQLKETEVPVNSSVDSEPVTHGVQTDHVTPKHLRKINSPPSVSSAPFSATEELIWDWQAVALALAVFACLLFFLVACAYSVHHARQWRRLKDHFDDFEADVGELSTRLSLLLPTVNPEEGGAGTVQTDCCSNTSQCLYLEELLARKRQAEEEGEHGNVYIDRDVTTGHRGLRA